MILKNVGLPFAPISIKVFVLLLQIVLMPNALAKAVEEFTVVEIGYPAGAFLIDERLVINDVGIVAGAATFHYELPFKDMRDYPPKPPKRAFIWEKGKFQLLDQRDTKARCVATAINNKTEVVGYCEVKDQSSGFSWKQGTMTAFEPEAGSLRYITSTSRVITSKANVYSIDATLIRKFQWPEGASSFAFQATNDHSVIVGRASYLERKENFTRVMVLNNDGTSHFLDCPDGDSCRIEVEVINNFGMAVGTVSAQGASVPCYWANGKPVPLLPPKPGTWTRVKAVNDEGIIVGSTWTNPNERDVFIWQKEYGLRRVQEMLDNESKNWTVKDVDTINNRSWIVARASKSGANPVPVLLIPKSK
jgi:uncharacterized membrane protein